MVTFLIVPLVVGKITQSTSIFLSCSWLRSYWEFPFYAPAPFYCFRAVWASNNKHCKTRPEDEGSQIVLECFFFPRFWSWTGHQLHRALGLRLWKDCQPTGNWPGPSYEYTYEVATPAHTHIRGKASPYRVIAFRHFMGCQSISFNALFIIPFLPSGADNGAKKLTDFPRENSTPDTHSSHMPCFALTLPRFCTFGCTRAFATSWPLDMAEVWLPGQVGWFGCKRKISFLSTPTLYEVSPAVEKWQNLDKPITSMKYTLAIETIFRSMLRLLCRFSLRKGTNMNTHKHTQHTRTHTESGKYSRVTGNWPSESRACGGTCEYGGSEVARCVLLWH